MARSLGGSHSRPALADTDGGIDAPLEDGSPANDGSLTTHERQPGERAEEPKVPTYARPKIMLVDLPEAAEAILSAGFNATLGTLGRPYEVDPSTQLVRITPAGRLPGYTEQEILVFDLTSLEAEGSPPDTAPLKEDQLAYWAECVRGVVNPRIPTLRTIKKDVDRILKAGGLVVVFADPRTDDNLSLGRLYGKTVQPSETKLDIWDFFSLNDNLIIDRDYGAEVTVVEQEPPLNGLAELLRQHAHQADFHCTVRGWDDDWVTLAQNKYGDSVAGILTNKKTSGFVLVFPHFVRKTDFLVGLLTVVLPSVIPGLYPSTGTWNWIHRREYEHPGVLAQLDAIERIRREASDEVAQRQAAAAEVCTGRAHLHAILTESGDNLVDAVERTLKDLGFQNVVNVDNLDGNEDESRREDLQILDGSPRLLLEIKGIGGNPRENDALAVQKYLARRMREWDRTDVTGVFMVNHQRNRPPLDRDRDCFQRDVVATAEKDGNLGLMTTWDLFRLRQSAERNGWGSDLVHPILNRPGRISPVPPAYMQLGEVDEYWPQAGAFSIIPSSDIRVGDHILLETPTLLVEQRVGTLQRDKEALQHAEAGTVTAIGWHSDVTPRHGMAVFLLKQELPDVG